MESGTKVFSFKELNDHWNVSYLEVEHEAVYEHLFCDLKENMAITNPSYS